MGSVSDDTGVVALTINGRSILRRQGKNIFWNQFVRLEPGQNRLVIEARDDAGNTANHTLTIQRNIPQALQLEERLNMSILPFEHKGEISTAALAFQDNLILALMAQNRFNVVERDRLDAILAEQKLSRTQLIDPGTAVKLGRLAAAQAVMAGSIIQTSTGIEIVGRLIDTETSQILATQDVYDEISDLDAMRLLANGMANKFHREFPLLGGEVIKHKGQYVFTTLGQGQNKAATTL